MFHRASTQHFLRYTNDSTNRYWISTIRPFKMKIPSLRENKLVHWGADEKRVGGIGVLVVNHIFTDTELEYTDSDNDQNKRVYQSKRITH